MYKRTIVIELASPTRIDLEQVAEDANYELLGFISMLSDSERDQENYSIKVKINWGKWIKGE